MAHGASALLLPQMGTERNDAGLPRRVGSACAGAEGRAGEGGRSMMRHALELRGSHRTADFLKLIGVPDLLPALSPFDPGYDPVTLESHLDQSAHLMSMLKLSMACWMIADEGATRRKPAAARRHGVPTVTGGGPFEVAVARGRLPEYLDLCADLGVTRVECGAGFTDCRLEPRAVVAMARGRGLEVQFELGRKNGGALTRGGGGAVLDVGRRGRG